MDDVGSCPLMAGRLMAEGYGFGGERDWRTSVMLYTIKAIGADSLGGASQAYYRLDSGT